MEDKPLTTEQFEEGMRKPTKPSGMAALEAIVGEGFWENVFDQYANPVFNALDDKSRKMIISEMRKSVTLY